MTRVEPGDCPHPIEARVSPIGEMVIGRGGTLNRVRGPIGAIARCHDCAGWMTRTGWVWLP